MYVYVCRYGSGYTLQAKINSAIVAPTNIPNPTSESPLPALEAETSVAAPHNVPPKTVAVGSAQGVVIDTTGLKYFIEQSFPGARLVEEHQVCACVSKPSQ